MESEGVFDDQAEYLRDAAYVDDDDHDSQHYVGHGHHRHHDLAEARYAADASEYDDQRESRQQDAHPLAGECVAFFEGTRYGVGLHGVECESECEDDQHCERHGPPPAADAFGDIVGRSAAE